MEYVGLAPRAHAVRDLRVLVGRGCPPYKTCHSRESGNPLFVLRICGRLIVLRYQRVGSRLRGNDIMVNEIAEHGCERAIS